MPRTNVFVCRSSRIVVEAVGTFFFCFQANQISTGGVKRRRKWSHSCSCDSTTDGHQYSRLCFSDTASAIGCQHTISSNQHIVIIKFGHSVNRKTGLCVSPKGMNWSLSPPNYVVSYDRRKSSFIHLSLFYIYLSVITLSPQSLSASLPYFLFLLSGQKSIEFLFVSLSHLSVSLSTLLAAPPKLVKC